MACRNCGKRAVSSARRPQRAKPVEQKVWSESSFVALRYTGTNRNALVLTGRSGRRYNVSVENPVIIVEPRDARRFLAMGCFERASADDIVETTDLPDPAALTVAQVKALKLRREQVAAMLERERRGKGRKSVVKYLERQLKEE